MKHFISVAEIQQQQEGQGAYMSWDINLPPHIDPERLRTAGRHSNGGWQHWPFQASPIAYSVAGRYEWRRITAQLPKIQGNGRYQ